MVVNGGCVLGSCVMSRWCLMMRWLGWLMMHWLGWLSMLFLSRFVVLSSVLSGCLGGLLSFLFSFLSHHMSLL